MPRPRSQSRSTAIANGLIMLMTAWLCVSCASPKASQASAPPKTSQAVGVSPNKITARLGAATVSSSAAATSAPTPVNSTLQQPPTPFTVAERSIGAVRMIGASQHFVLIEIPWNVSNMPLDNGQELHCRAPAEQGGTQTALVRVGRERRQQFVVADIVSGKPNIGDSVFLSADHAASAPLPNRSTPAPLLPTTVPATGVLFPPPAAALAHP